MQQIANSAEIDNQLRDGVFIYNRTVIVTTIWHTWANLFAFKRDNISELPHSLRTVSRSSNIWRCGEVLARVEIGGFQV